MASDFISGGIVRDSYTNANTSGTSVPALSISNQGTGSTPEPNYYGVKILLKY